MNQIQAPMLPPHRINFCHRFDLYQIAYQYEFQNGENAKTLRKSVLNIASASWLRLADSILDSIAQKQKSNP